MGIMLIQETFPRSIPQSIGSGLMRTALRAFVAAFAFFVVFLVATAAMAAVVDPGTDPIGWVGGIVEAFKDGDVRLVVAGGMIGAVALFRWLAGHVGWFQGDRGGAVAVLVIGVLGSVSTALATDTPFSLGLVGGGLLAGFTAAGGYAVVKKIIWPSDSK